jgi:hypothetical protein
MEINPVTTATIKVPIHCLKLFIALESLSPVPAAWEPPHS